MLVTNLCLESEPECYEDCCELLAAIHGDKCRRHDKDVRLGRAVASSSKPKVKTVTHSGTCIIKAQKGPNLLKKFRC